jgi:hypothetical protein
MHNENRTEGEKQVPQGTLEAILKLADSGSPPEAICLSLGLKAQTVQQIIANDPKHRARVIQPIKEKSRKYRCTQSNRLMVSPVMAYDGNFYEQSILEADSFLSINQSIPSPKLKAKIGDFCKESLKVLERYLQQKHPQEDILELIAECLSVLCPEAGLEPALRVLGIVEGETVRKLTWKMWSLVQEEIFHGLMRQTERELPSHALYLSALIILKTRNERAFAFRCFTEQLSHALGPEAIDLAEEVSERLSSTQLRQMNAALGACPREGGDRLDGLRLKEAYALLREGEVDAAICLVNTLHISPRLENEVLRFFDEAGMSSGKVPILEQRLSAKLEEISRDSPSVAETLSIIHQLLNAELHSRKSEVTSQNLIRLKAEVLNETLAKLGQPTSHALAQDARIKRLEEQAKRKEADCQETLSNLRVKVEALTEEFVRAGQSASRSQTAQEAALRSIEEKSKKSEAVAQQTLSSLRNKVEALTGEHLKAGEEVKSVKTAHNIQIQSLDKKFNKAEAATQQTLNVLRGNVETLRVDLDQKWSQCKQAQEPMRQDAISEKTQAVLAHTLVSYSTSPPTTTEEAKQSQPPKPQHTPTFFYSCEGDTNQLHRVNLITGEKSCHEVPPYQFKYGCRWSELPGGSLLITGGGFNPGVRDVVRLDVGTFEVSPQPPMHTPRYYHAAVSHSQYVYVLGISECERYSCAESRWEVLPALPVAGCDMSGVEVENSVYALGAGDTVQKLSLDSLTWQLMQLKLPQGANRFPCFKKDTEVYLVISKTLYSFTPLQVKAVKTLDTDIRGSSSYYSRGTLYYEYGSGISSYEL